MSVTIAPRPPETEDERTVEERIAELEALIKEARRRARRRRAAYAAVVMVALGGAVAGAAGIGNGGAGVDTSVAHSAAASATNTARAGDAAVVGSPWWISAIQVDPKRPNVVYASTLPGDLDTRSVLKSIDGGKTWSAADTGLTVSPSPTGSEDLRVDALALDPRSPNVLYAGTGAGVFKTTDGATTWKLASTGIAFTGKHALPHRLYEGFIQAIAIDPLHTSTVYAAGRPRGGVWKSTNGGTTWKRVLRKNALGLVSDPRRPRIVYASLDPGGSLFKTVDGGDSWRATAPFDLRDHELRRPIVVDRRAPGIVYAAGSRGLFASADRARTWTKLLSRGVGAIALDPSRAGVVYVAVRTHGILKSEDGGRSWSALRLDRRGFISSIAIAPTRPRTIYAGAQWKTAPNKVTAGLFVSTDGGATWRRLFF